MNSRHEQSRALSIEPELELHSVEEQKEGFEDELSERMEEIVALRAAVQSQRETIRDLQKSKLPNQDSFTETKEAIISPESESKETNSFDVDSYAWTDDDDYSDPLESINRAFHDSIKAIQEEASRVDAIMAIDQVDTLKQEVRAVKRELKDRSAEVEELRALVDLKDDRLATLELERDLFKADTSKLREDLRGYLEQIKISKEEARNQPILPPPVPRQGSPDRSPVRGPDTASVGKQRIVQKASRDARIPSLAATPLPDGDSSITGSIYTSFSSRGPEASRLMESAAMPPTKGKSPRCLSGQRVRAWVSLPRNASSRKSKHENSKSEVEMSEISLEAHVERLSQRLQASMETSEELRKRLAMISSYYETLVRRLQVRAVEIEADRTKMETDLCNQINSIEFDNRKNVGLLEKKLQWREEEIARLRHKVAKFMA